MQNEFSPVFKVSIVSLSKYNLKVPSPFWYSRQSFNCKPCKIKRQIIYPLHTIVPNRYYHSVLGHREATWTKARPKPSKVNTISCSSISNVKCFYPCSFADCSLHLLLKPTLLSCALLFVGYSMAVYLYCLGISNAIQVSHPHVQAMAS